MAAASIPHPHLYVAGQRQPLPSHRRPRSPHRPCHAQRRRVLSPRRDVMRLRPRWSTGTTWSPGNRWHHYRSLQRHARLDRIIWRTMERTVSYRPFRPRRHAQNLLTSTVRAFQRSFHTSIHFRVLFSSQPIARSFVKGKDRLRAHHIYERFHL